MRPVWGPRCRAMVGRCSVSSFVANGLTLPGQCLRKPQVYLLGVIFEYSMWRMGGTLMDTLASHLEVV